MFKPLPTDDEALIFRSDVHLYGFPKPATLAKWACRPSECPADLPYTLVGRRAAYRVGDLRRLRKEITFQHTTERTQAINKRKARKTSQTKSYAVELGTVGSP